ncbi:hypothetical protein Tco_1008627 [Tanacetum coccineum]
MATMAENVIVAGKENGEMFIDSINKGPFQLKKDVTIPASEGTPEHKHEQRLEDLTLEEKLRKSCDIEATNIIFLGLPIDIYTLVNHQKQQKKYGIRSRN